MIRLVTTLLRRPVGVSAVLVGIVAFAIMAWVRLPVALLPSLAYPAFVIWTGWPEVPPEQVERGITQPIEQAMAGIRGVREVQSRSQLGGSMVSSNFAWDTDLDATSLDIRQKLDRLLGILPERSARPIVMRVNPSERPILVLALGSEEVRHPTAAALLEWKKLAVDVVSRRLEQLPGVARVRVSGGFSREIRIDLDREKMDAYGVDLPTLETALEQSNVSLAGGTIKKGLFRYAVEVSGELRDLEDVARTTLSRPNMPPIRVSDIARVSEEVVPRRGLVRFDGHEVLLLLVERRPGANTVETAAEVRQTLEAVKHELPRLRLDVVVDESHFIEQAIDGVLQALLWGGGLAVLVLVVFLRRPVLLAAVALAMPLSLALALIAFDVLGMTLNLVSLSGLALGIGLLVDNAIIVVENIARWREKGADPHLAAAGGTAEVAGPILASTLTTLAVFLPLIFVQGLAGRLFRDQSLAVVSSVGASLLVALTIVPLLASRDRDGARPVPSESPPSRGFELYESLLKSGLRRPLLVLGLAVVFSGFSAWVALHLPAEVVPKTDNGRLSVRLGLPTDADLEYVDERAGALEAELLEMPEVAHVLADLGERADARLDLDPRPPFAADFSIALAADAELDRVLSRLELATAEPGLTMVARRVPTQLEQLLVSGEADLALDFAAADRGSAYAAAEEALGTLRSRPEFAQVEWADAGVISTFDLKLDRDAVSRYGIVTAGLDAWIEAAVRGREITRLQRVGEQIPIVSRVRVDSIEDLLQDRIVARFGKIPLRELVRIEVSELPVTLRRRGQAPVVRLVADLAPGRGIEEAVAAVESVVDDRARPGVSVRISGANQIFQQSLVALGWSLAFSVLLVYLILAAQFESLLQPLVVLLVVPIAIGGVAISLALAQQTWNILSLTGCVVLVGIAVNDAIVKVDFIRRRQKEGMDITSAVIRAGRERFRPILMTTWTTFLGLLPLAVGWGAGASLRAPLAIAIAGGLWVATFVSLVIVPVAAARLAMATEPSSSIADSGFRADSVPASES